MSAFLYLDIDGVLNPWEATSTPTTWPDFEQHSITLNYGSGFQQRFKMWLSRELGAAIDALHDLDVQVIWATTWAADANPKIGTKIGIRRIPHLPYDIMKDDSGDDECGKLPFVTQHWEANRDGRHSRAVWVDDNLGPKDFGWLSKQQDAEYSIWGINPHPALGITPEMLDEITRLLIG